MANTANFIRYITPSFKCESLSMQKMQKRLKSITLTVLFRKFEKSFEDKGVRGNFNDLQCCSSKKIEEENKNKEKSKKEVFYLSVDVPYY